MKYYTKGGQSQKSYCHIRQKSIAEYVSFIQTYRNKMDLYDRKIIGWSYGKNITAELATQAVKNACLNIPDTEGIILHSDLGSQYTSDEFENYLKSQGMLHSFSRKGNPYDNACIESFHSVLKKEEVYTTVYQTFEEAKTALFEYIESFYNRKRPQCPWLQDTTAG